MCIHVNILSAQGCVSLSSHGNNKEPGLLELDTHTLAAEAAPRDEMKSEQGDDNDATCGGGGDVRIPPPHSHLTPQPPVSAVSLLLQGLC